jgi:hypothetical protein
MCGLSTFDVFSLGLLDPTPQSRVESCSLSSTLEDPQLCSSNAVAAPQLEQQSSTSPAFLTQGQPAGAAQRAEAKLGPQMSSIRDQLRHLVYPPLMGEVWGQLPAYDSSLSVFVPVSYAHPLQVR